MSFASQSGASIRPGIGSSESVRVSGHIALLLPTRSAKFARPAEAVKSGFLAGARAHGATQLPIRLYPLGDDPQTAVGAYRDALASGARFVVGPLTRNAVTALAASGAVTIPTVVLNAPESAGALPRNLYVLSLQAEAEARQVARFAAHDGRTRALTVFGDTPLAQRIHKAFVDEFARTGGTHTAEHSFNPDREQLLRIRQTFTGSDADMAFIALDSQQARHMRPYLGTLPLYATSHVLTRQAGRLAAFDLANVRFMDMPWLLQPDHPAVMVYQQRELQADLELERLHALGIDAFRIAHGLLQDQGDSLDGVTGRLTLNSDRYYERELTRAQFTDGRLIVYGDSQ